MHNDTILVRFEPENVDMLIKWKSALIAEKILIRDRIQKLVAMDLDAINLEKEGEENGY